MPEQYSLQEAPKPPVEVPKKNLNHYLIAVALVVGFILIFVFGLMLGKSSSPKPQVAVGNPTPTSPVITSTEITPLPSSAPEVPIVSFLPDKQYLDDTYVVISQDKPHQTLILSVSRIEQEHTFVEYTKTNYFNGTVWDRKSTTATIDSSTVTTNPLLRSWKPLTINSSSNPQALATVALPASTISFLSNDLANEISIQSLPGSTKFIYEGKGTMTISNETHPAYIFYSRTYSFNAVDLSYLTKPDQLNSNWLLFWDKEGSFYYIDDHNGTRGTTSIPTFAIGVREDNNNTVLRTPAETTTIEILNSAPVYTATFSLQRDEDVLLPLINTLNKADKKTYTWITGSGEGTVVKAEGRKVGGLGVVEYIRQKDN